MAFTPDGRCLLANSREGNTSDRNTAAVYALRIWDIKIGTLWHESDCGNIEIYPNSFSRDKSWIALPCNDTIKLWNTNSRMLFTINPSKNTSLDEVRFLPNSYQIVATSRGRIFFYIMKTPTFKRQGERRIISQVLFLPAMVDGSRSRISKI
jgi:WD40 repeat protein